jgi:hypothetical protein
MQLLPDKNNKSSATLHELTDFSHLPIATHPVDRRNQILLTSQSLDETKSELLLE